MSDFEKWQSLKSDIERAVEEGVERGFNMTPDTADGGKFVAYRYVLDYMDRLDEAAGVPGRRRAGGAEVVRGHNNKYAK